LFFIVAIAWFNIAIWMDIKTIIGVQDYK
jgi:hypothetical protein